jgi:hypothetical protein
MRYLRIEVDDALTIAEQVDLWAASHYRSPGAERAGDLFKIVPQSDLGCPKRGPRLTARQSGVARLWPFPRVGLLDSAVPPPLAVIRRSGDYYLFEVLAFTARCTSAALGTLGTVLHRRQGSL